MDALHQIVSGLALRNGVNANLLRHWMHWQSGTLALLPVTVLAQQPCADVVVTTCRRRPCWRPWTVWGKCLG